MAIVTRQQFIEELMVRSDAAGDLDGDVVHKLLDIALRAYSQRLPKVKWSVSNAVVAGQVLYDFPDGALNVVRVRDSNTREQVSYNVEDQGNGRKIRLGNRQRRSYTDLLEQDFYSDPLSQESQGVVGSCSAFDVEYVTLQTVETINETGLEAVAFYVEYLALNKESLKAAKEATLESSQIPSSLTDASPDGASTTVSFTTKSDVSKNLERLATAKLKQYEDKIVDMPYGTRG